MINQRLKKRFQRKLTVSIIFIAVISLFSFSSLIKNIQASPSSDLDQDAIYLSNLTPDSSKVGWGTLAKDKSLLKDKKIQLKEDGSEIKEFSKGITAHAPAELVFDLNIPKQSGKNTFSSIIGIQNSMNEGSVSYKFYLDDTLVHSTNIIKHPDVQHVIFPIQNHNKLRISISSEGPNSQDHSVLADAKFNTKTISNTDISKLKEIINTNFNPELSPLNETARMAMLQARYLDKIGLMTHDYIRYFDKDTEDISLDKKSYLNWLYNDTEALSMLNEIPKLNGTGLGFLRVFKRLYRFDETIRSDSLNKRIALAVASAFSKQITFWIDLDQKIDPVARYEIFRNLSRVDNQLRPIFFKIDTAHMVSVVQPQITNEDLLWLREKIKKEHPKRPETNNGVAGTTFQYINYTDTNPFGDSIHRPRFYGLAPDISMVIKYGGVCGTISKFGSFAINGFGMPGMLVGQPGHAAIIYIGDDNKWNGTNWISGWGDTYGIARTPTLERETNNNGTYNHISWDSQKNENYNYARELLNHTNYLTTKDDTYIASVNKVINLNPLYLPAYHDKLEFLDKNNSSQYDYLNFAFEISENLYSHPFPMTELLTKIKNRITNRNKFPDESKDRILLNDFYAKYLEALDKIKQGDEFKYARENIPDSLKKKITEAKFFLGEFNFSGKDAHKFLNSKTDTDYSLDGGKTWLPIKEPNYQISQAQVNSINSENNILLKVRGSKYSIPLVFTKSETPQVAANDKENFIRGISLSMEYSLDNGSTWIKYSDIRPDLSGNATVLVRRYAEGTTFHSDHVTLKFTSEEIPKDYDNIPSPLLSIARNGGEEAANGEGAINAIDDRPETIWHSRYNRGGEKYLVINFNKPYTLTGITYVPRINGKNPEDTNGVAKKIRISYSNNKDANDSEMNTYNNVIELNYNGNYNNSVKIPLNNITAHIVKFEIVEGINNFGSAAELKFHTTNKEALDALNSLKNIDKRAKARLLGRLYTLQEEYLESAKNIENPEIKNEIQSLVEELNNVSSFKDKTFSELNIIAQDIYSRYNNAIDRNLIIHNDSLPSPNSDTTKINEIEDANIISSISNKYSDILNSPSNFNLKDLSKVYFYIKGTPESVQEHFKEKTTAIYSVINNINPDRQLADSYTENFKTLLNSSDSKYIEKNIGLAKYNFDILPKSARKLLQEQQNKLNNLENKAKENNELSIKILENSIRNKEAYISNAPQQDTEKLNNTKLAIEEAKSLLQNPSLNRSEYDKQTYNIMMAFHEYQHAKKTNKLLKTRAKIFKLEHKNILNKPLSSINSGDLALYESAEQLYTRLDPDSKKLVLKQRERLDKIKQIINGEIPAPSQSEDQPIEDDDTDEDFSYTETIVDATTSDSPDNKEHQVPDTNANNNNSNPLTPENTGGTSQDNQNNQNNQNNHTNQNQQPNNSSPDHNNNSNNHNKEINSDNNSNAKDKQKDPLVSEQPSDQLNTKNISLESINNTQPHSTTKQKNDINNNYVNKNQPSANPSKQAISSSNNKEVADNKEIVDNKIKSENDILINNTDSDKIKAEKNQIPEIITISGMALTLLTISSTCIILFYKKRHKKED